MSRSLLFMLLLVSGSVLAVPPAYVNLGKEIGVPAQIIYAVAKQESQPPRGRVEGVNSPWPWTANCGGQGYFFSNKDDGSYFVKSALLSGIYCDIGLMQMNWRYHSHRFNSIDDAFDPYLNIQAGGQYLKELYKKYGSWDEAVAKYHIGETRSTSSARANSYRNSVKNHLINVIGGDS